MYGGGCGWTLGEGMGNGAWGMGQRVSRGGFTQEVSGFYQMLVNPPPPAFAHRPLR